MLSTSAAMSLDLYAIDPIDQAPWPLHVAPGTGAHLALIGWDTPADVVDASPHASVATAIASALTAVARVTFLFDPTDAGGGADDWRSTPSGDRQWRLAAPRLAALRGAAALHLCSTVRPDRARSIFDAGRFDWTQGGQAVFLSALDQPPPPLSYRQVAAVAGARGADAGALALDRAILGLALPGVDGDFVELVGLADGLVPRVIDALRAACVAQGGSFASRDAASLRPR